jgi:hypothetical protein
MGTAVPRARTADVAVLTVIPAELDAARAALGIDDETREKDADGTIYLHGVVRSDLAGRDYSVVLCCIPRRADRG